MLPEPPSHRQWQQLLANGVGELPPEFRLPRVGV